MFLTLLAIAAVLIGGWMFATVMFKVSDAGTKKPSIPDRKVSLWSLVLLIFLPEFNAPRLSSVPPRELN